MPPSLPPERCALTAPFHPYSWKRVPGAVYFLWHWPSTGFDARIPDVIRHTTLRSSDFPPPVSLHLRTGSGSDRPVLLPELVYRQSAAAPSTLFFRVVAHGLVDDLPTCFVFAHEAFVELSVEVIEFALELAVVIEALGVDGGFGDGAAGLAGVGAITKTAALGDVLDVLEADVGVVGHGPELDFAKAGHVDEEPAARHDKHGAGGGSVAAAIIVFADFGGGLTESAEKMVDEGGFAHSGGADEGCCFALCHGVVYRLNSVTGCGTDGEDGYAGCHDEAMQDLVEIEMEGGGEVGFVEKDNGTCTALLGEDEKALDAALIEVAIEAADDEENVDVGGEYLLLH